MLNELTTAISNAYRLARQRVAVDTLRYHLNNGGLTVWSAGEVKLALRKVNGNGSLVGYDFAAAREKR